MLHTHDIIDRPQVLKPDQNFAILKTIRMRMSMRMRPRMNTNQLTHQTGAYPSFSSIKQF